MLDLTLIIPSSDRPDALTRTLASLRRAGVITQVEETFVVSREGDGETAAVVEKEIQSGWKIDLLPLSQNKGNAALARNAGISAATSSHVLFLDNDILVEEHFFSVLADCLRSWPDGVLLGRIDNLESGGRLTPDTRLEWLDSETTVRWPWRLFWSGLFCCPRQYLKQGFSPIFLGWGQEDIELGYRLFRQEHPLVYSSQLTGMHRTGENPRNPFERQARGLPADFTSFLDNCCRMILLHCNDLEPARCFAELEMSRFSKQGAFVSNVDSPGTRGYEVLTSRLRSFKQRNPSDRLVDNVDFVIQNLTVCARLPADETDFSASQQNLSRPFPHYGSDVPAFSIFAKSGAPVAREA